MFGWYVTKCHDSGIIHNVRFEKLDNSQISATGNQNSSKKLIMVIGHNEKRYSEKKH